MKRSFFLSVGSLFLLTACTTRVITQEERERPVAREPVLMADVTAEEMGDVTVDMDQSYISFIGSKGSIISHEGKFESFDFDFTFDEEAPEDTSKSTVTVTIDIGSIVTDSDGLTKHLLSPDFFEVETYPEATFVSTHVEQKSEFDYTITGDLTVKDVTQSITFDAEITNSYVFMTYDLDRTTFGVGLPTEGLKAIDAIVPIEAKIVYARG